MSDNEESSWEEFSKKIKPLHDDHIKELPKTPKEIIINNPPGSKQNLTSKEYNKLKPLEPNDFSALNAADARKLRTGKYIIDATMDLHGFTQDQAIFALEEFIERNFILGKRCLLVITGRGKPDHESVLKAMLPKWLNMPNLREKILTISYADRRHGSDGALYVLLRKKMGI